MNTDRLVAGLDIGSARTTAIIGEVVSTSQGETSIKVLGVGQARTTGMRRGIVSDIEETTRSIRKALQDAERMAGAEITDVYTGIAGEHVRAMTSKGIVAVSNDEISKSDVDRANEVARAQATTGSEEVVVASTASSPRCAEKLRHTPALARGSSTIASTTNVASRSTSGSRLIVTLPLTRVPSFSQSLCSLACALSQEPSERANTVTWPRPAATAARPHAMAPDPAIAKRSDTTGPPLID